MGNRFGLIQNRQIFAIRLSPRLYKSAVVLGIFACLGCSPRIAIETPDKPITINLNVKIDHEVKVKVEKDLDQVISADSKLF